MESNMTVIVNKIDFERDKMLESISIKKYKGTYKVDAREILTKTDENFMYKERWTTRIFKSKWVAVLWSRYFMLRKVFSLRIAV